MLDLKINGKSEDAVKLGDNGKVIVTDKEILKSIEDALDGKPLDLEDESK